MKSHLLTAAILISLLSAAAFGQTTRPAHPTTRTGVLAPNHNPDLPTVFLIGDSTVKNSWDQGDGQLWGWGHPIAAFFDPSKINVDNQALGGTSSRSYYLSNWHGRFPVESLVKKGDFVIMQFGHNDGPATIKGNDDTTRPAAAGRGPQDPVHSFGWYIRQYIAETKAAGATPIVCSLIPRYVWVDGKVTRDTGTYASTAKQAAEQGGAFFIDLNALIADQYDKLGPDAVHALFGPKETVHTNWNGAVLNAQCVVAGIKSLQDCPLKGYLSATPDPQKPSWAP